MAYSYQKRAAREINKVTVFQRLFLGEARTQARTIAKANCSVIFAESSKLILH
jgi:hypothetical protein